MEGSKGNFVVLRKLDVNGSGMHPMYHYLKKNSPLYRARTDRAMPILWNYGKFLVDPQGKVVEFSKPTSSPLDLEPAIRKLCGV